MSHNEEVMADLIEESLEHLENIEPDFMEMESSGDATSPDLVNRVFRAMHSIKGGFGFFGINNIVKLAHVMENILMRVRDGNSAINIGMVEALLAGCDTLRVMIEDISSSDTVDISLHLKQLSAYDEGSEDTTTHNKEKKTTVNKEDEISRLPQEHQDLVRERIQAGDTLCVITHKDDDKELLIKELDSTGEVIHRGEIVGHPGVLFKTVMDRDMIKMQLDGKDVGVYLIGKDPLPEPPAVQQQDSQNETSQQDHKGHSKSADSIRVRTDILSKLMDGAGELILGRNRVMDLAEQSILNIPGVKDRLSVFKDNLSNSKQTLLNDLKCTNNKSNIDIIEKEYMRIVGLVENLLSTNILEAPGAGTIFQNLSQVSSELQSNIMGTRLQPVSVVFSKFPRVIRSMNQKLGKEIDLQLEGEDVELDKSVIEGLGDPLTHLIRNSADHGVEKPEVRENKGKPRKGIVKLSARHVGSQVHIIIQDDGAGIDTSRIRAKAIENKMMSTEEADALPEKDVYKLIFAAGFSTAQEVSDISGRGVGMDVVRNNIENLGGRIDIDSILGIGTTLTLILPLTLAIIPSLGVDAASKRYVIPQVAIEELVRVTPEESHERIATVGGKPVLKLRNSLLPLVNLREVLGLKSEVSDGKGDVIEDRRQGILNRRSLELTLTPEDSPPSENCHRKSDRRNQKTGRKYIAVLKSMGSRYGLVVDRLHSPQEVVVKPLSERLKQVGVYAGATIQSDGNVSMILDIDGIARESQIRLDEKMIQSTNEHVNIKESQTMLEFKFGTSDHFAINLCMVSRIEEVRQSQLQKTGDQEFIKYDNNSLRVIRLSDHINITPSQKDPERLFVLVPRLVPQAIGILIEKPLGVFETDNDNTIETMDSVGVHGQQVIDGRMILFLNLFSLFDKIEPNPQDKHKSKNIFKGKKVLLAEDTKLFQAVIHQYLESLGFSKVHTVSNGALAWEAMQEDDYDLVITDIVMPEMDGMELCRTIKSSDTHYETPVIAVTSLLNENDRQTILESGVDAYEQKLDKNTLGQTIEDILNNRESA
ncbi:MAG: chemotaxis protein CheW [Planctomycetes bacterium]|nr:chemotaxis protein CheW [Planctomycetota bacterium]